ncbi:MAG: NfeD family protein [Bacteroidales bacterium]|nr:NfeD family protein [Bacteroidales bacterium]
MEIWHIWVIVALVFMILEVFTTGFAIACLSFGCLASAICSACGLAFGWQILAFALLSGLAFVTVRPLVLKFFFKKEEVPMNADAVIGRSARVSQRIDSANGSGRVAIDGDDWKAVSDEIIEEGAIVEVVSRDSIILTVKSK